VRPPQTKPSFDPSSPFDSDWGVAAGFNGERGGDGGCVGSPPSTRSVSGRASRDSVGNAPKSGDFGENGSDSAVGVDSLVGVDSVDGVDPTGRSSAAVASAVLSDSPWQPLPPLQRCPPAHQLSFDAARTIGRTAFAPAPFEAAQNGVGARTITAAAFENAALTGISSRSMVRAGAFAAGSDGESMPPAGASIRSGVGM